MAVKQRWSDLSESRRRLIVIGGAFEGALKIAALRDIRRRPASRIRGSKAVWTVAIVLINAAGGAPLAYFVFGRRGPKAATASISTS